MNTPDMGGSTARKLKEGEKKFELFMNSQPMRQSRDSN